MGHVPPCKLSGPGILDASNFPEGLRVGEGDVVKIREGMGWSLQDGFERLEVDRAQEGLFIAVLKR